jgi:hypothetical protein
MNPPRNYTGEVLHDEDTDQRHRNCDPRADIPDAEDTDDFGFDTAGEAKANGKDSGEEQAESAAGVSLGDFIAYMPAHGYIFVPSRELWPAASVNARVPPIVGPDGKPIAPSKWLASNAAVEQMTWAPGDAPLIRDKLISDGGWIKRSGCTVFNLYKPPTIRPITGDVTRWLDLIQRNYPEQADHIVAWLAHRVQRPDEKINHALVLGGVPGIGKDTILEPVKQAIGAWNFTDVSPKQVLGRFNGFLRSVILRVNEARDLGEFDRFAFFDHMKVFIASPPDVLRVDEKNLKEHTSRTSVAWSSPPTTRRMAFIYRPTTGATWWHGQT